MLLLFRPSIFGERYNQAVFVIFFIITCVLLLIRGSQSLSISKRLFIGLILIYLCIGYFFIQGLLLSNATQTVVNSCVLLLLAVPCIALVLSKYQQKVLKVFINFHYFLSISAIITFVIFIIVGLSINRLPVLADLSGIIDYKAYGENVLNQHILIFPYTIAWSTGGFLGIDVPRFVGIYREPGMSQIFFITAFTLTFFVPITSHFRKRVIILMGIILLFSAAGMLNLVLVVFFVIIFNASFKRYLIRILRNPIFVIAVIIGLVMLSKQAITMVKEKIIDVSGTTRIESFNNGVKRLMKNPFFGEGYYNSFKKDGSGTVVSENFIGILGVSYQIGFVGMFFYFLCWLNAFRHNTRRVALCIYIPCLMTLLFSQPSYNDVFTWFLLLLDTRNFQY